MIVPSLETERRLFAEGAPGVIGMDEVGRGAIAGPATVGALLLRPDAGPIPEHLRDSKLMTAKRREAVAPLVAEWGVVATGSATAAEIDDIGITKALALAGRRALAALHGAGVDVVSSVILLDGKHDWLSPALRRPLSITTKIKADRDCGSVAGAACTAKVERDAWMVKAHADAPGYGWASNKGYGSAAHFAAIASLGQHPLHRSTWIHPALPG